MKFSTPPILPIILSLAFSSGCLLRPNAAENPAATNPTTPTNASELTGNDTVIPQTPVSLSVLGVCNANVTSLTLGKTYKAYKLTIGTLENLSWENTFRSTNLTTTGTPSLYVDDMEGLNTLRVPRTFDLSGTSVSRNGRQADKLVYGSMRPASYRASLAIEQDTYAWYDGLIPMFEVFASEATPSDELEYTIGNGCSLAAWMSNYCTLNNAGNITVPGMSCKEINATITVKDSDGKPIDNLTRENFEIKNGLERPYYGYPGYRITLLEQLETKVTALGEGSYQIYQIIPVSLSTSGITGRLRITVSIVGKSGTGTLPAQIEVL